MGGLVFKIYRPGNRVRGITRLLVAQNVKTRKFLAVSLEGEVDWTDNLDYIGVVLFDSDYQATKVPNVAALIASIGCARGGGS